jgi:hypothetical protein
LNTLERKHGSGDSGDLRQAYDIDPDAFRSLIEALVELDQPVDPELISLAGLG